MKIVMNRAREHLSGEIPDPMGSQGINLSVNIDHTASKGISLFDIPEQMGNKGNLPV